MPLVIGRPLRRLEDPPLITGQGHYAGDIKLDGLLHMALVRSTLAHAHVSSIDLGQARAMAGVVAIWTAADLPEQTRFLTDWLPPDMKDRPRPVLVAGEVNSVGDAIVAVVAETPYQAEDAAAAIFVDLEPLPAAGTLEAALADGAPRVHEGMESNIGRSKTFEYGDADAAFSGDSVIARATLTTARICGAAMEPRVVTARREDDRLTVWASTQGVFTVRDQVAERLGLEKEQVRVIAEDVGGGFGPKGTVYPEEVLAAHAAWTLHRPVRWTASRSEDTATTVMGHGSRFEMEIAAGPDGRLRALRGRLLHDIGAYGAAGASQPDIIVPHMMSAYVLPAFKVQADVVHTNAAPTGFVRGGGRPLGNYVIERMLDRLARELDMDPAELRRKNLVQPGQMPYDTGFPQGRSTIVYDSGDYPRLLETALEQVRYEEVRRQQAQPDGRLVGVGVACCVESSGFGSGEPARVRLDRDGTAHLFLGSTPQGQGHRTFAAQVLADRLGWPLERIRVTAGDTSGTPFALLTAGSRSAIHVGNATSAVASSARRRLLERAAELIEADPVDLVLEDGVISVRGAPAKSLPVAQAIPEGGLDVTEKWDTKQGSAYSSGCHAAVVAVDPETGGVEILRYVIVCDTGRVLNPLTMMGQMHGGLAHGLGYALFEEAIYQPDGNFVSGSFLDYTMVSAPEMKTDIRVVSMDGSTDSNPEGVKGAGESGTIPVPATISNAVEDAIRRRNPEAIVNRLPVTPERLYDMLRQR